eukprot:376244_1
MRLQSESFTLSETRDVALPQIERLHIYRTYKILKFKKFMLILFYIIASVVTIIMIRSKLLIETKPSSPTQHVANRTIRGGQAHLYTNTDGDYVKHFNDRRSYLHEKAMLLLLSHKNLQISKVLNYNDSINTLVIQNVGSHTFEQFFTFLFPAYAKVPVTVYNMLWNQTINTINGLHSIVPPVIHNDIKPNNLVCSGDENMITMSIIDFGSSYCDAFGKIFSGNLISGPSFYGSCWSRNFIWMLHDTYLDNKTELHKIRTQFGIYSDQYSLAAVFFEYLFFVKFESSQSWTAFIDDISSYKKLYNLKIGQQYLMKFKQQNMSKSILDAVALRTLPEAVSNYRNRMFYELFTAIKADRKDEPALYDFMTELQPYILRGFHYGKHAWIEIKTMPWSYYRKRQLGYSMDNYLSVVKTFFRKDALQECENEREILLRFTGISLPIAHVILYNKTNDPNYNMYQCPKLWLQYVGDITFNKFVQIELPLLSLDDATFRLIS